MRYVGSFFLGILSFGLLLQAGVPPEPAWVTVLCADGSPCILTPTDSYEGVAFARQYLMPDPDGATLPWVECPPLPSGEHTQATCVGGGGKTGRVG